MEYNIEHKGGGGGGGGGRGGLHYNFKGSSPFDPPPQLPVRCVMTPAYSYCTLRSVRLCLRIETSIIFLLHNTCSNTKDIKIVQFFVFILIINFLYK